MITKGFQSEMCCIFLFPNGAHYKEANGVGLTSLHTPQKKNNGKIYIYQTKTWLNNGVYVLQIKGE